MGTYSIILLIVAMGIIAFSLVYTLHLAKVQKVIKGELDSKIPQSVQEHPFIGNPIFLTYALFFALVLLIVAFVALQSNW